eukprot:jgi/Mesen1/9050/ME000057S08477
MYMTAWVMDFEEYSLGLGLARSNEGSGMIARLPASGLQASNTKQINLQDILRMETIGDDGRVVLLHMKSRTMRLSLGKDSLQFALAVQRNMKTYLNRDMAVEKTTPAAMVDMQNARLAMLVRVRRTNFPFLTDILGLVISGKNDMEVIVEFREWRPTQYFIQERESFVGSFSEVMGLGKGTQFSIRLELFFPHTLPEKPLPLYQKSTPILYEFSVVKGYDVSGVGQRERLLVITTEHLVEQAGEEIIGMHNSTCVDVGSGNVLLHVKLASPSDRVFNCLALIGESRHSLELPDWEGKSRNECEIFFISRFMGVFMNYKDAQQLASPKAQAQWFPLLKDYACNIHLGDSLCIDARPLYAVGDVLRASLSLKPGIGASYAVTCCTVLQRLLASRACFDSIKNNPEFAQLLIQAMKSQGPVVAYSAAMTLRCAIKYYATEADVTVKSSAMNFLTTSSPAVAEAANKLVVLSADNLQVLVAQLQTHAILQQNALQAFESSLLVASDVLSATCRSRSPIMFRTNATLLRTALQKCSPSIAAHLQKMCIARCVLLLHLRTALFTKNERQRELSAHLVFLMAEGSSAVRAIIDNILPKGQNEPRRSKSSQDALKRSQQAADKANEFQAWLEALAVLRSETSTTPSPSRQDSPPEGIHSHPQPDPLWLHSPNDLRASLPWPAPCMCDVKSLVSSLLSRSAHVVQFLWEEVEAFDAASALAAGRELHYNNEDVELVYSPASDENGGSSPPPPPPFRPPARSYLEDPGRLFMAVFHALQLCFTPLYGTSNLPEIEPRLAMDSLTWIYERYAVDLAPVMDNLSVVQTVVAMLREAIDNEHHVFAFKAVFFLLLAMDLGGRRNVFRFVRAGGMPTIIPLMVFSLAKHPSAAAAFAAALVAAALACMRARVLAYVQCCKDVLLVECDATTADDAHLQGGVEKVPVVGADGEVRMARVPSGRSVDAAMLQDGTMDARDAIMWQDDSVPEKLQLGLALDLVEQLLRLSGHEANVEQFPPSAACQDLTRHEILYHLVQMLLRAKTPVYGRLLDILSALCKGNKSAQGGLHRFGLFEILLWKLMLPEGLAHAPVKGLIVVDHVPWHESYLRLYLPGGLVAKLIQEGPEAFRSLINAEEDSPEVIWSADMRARVLERLEGDLEHYVKARASDPMALFIYSPKPPVVFSELEDAVFVAPVYLHNLLDTKRFPAHQIVDPAAFHSSILQACLPSSFCPSSFPSSLPAPSPCLSRVPADTRRGARGGFRHFHVAPGGVSDGPTLRGSGYAQALVLERYPQIPLTPEAEGIVIDMATPALRVCIAQRDDCPPAMTRILANAAKMLRCIAATRDKYVRPRPSDAEVSQAAVNFGLSVLSLGTRMKPDGGFPDSAVNTPLEPALANALALLELAAATRSHSYVAVGFYAWDAACGAVKGFCDARVHSRVIPRREGHVFAEPEVAALLLPLLLITIPSEEALLAESKSSSKAAAAAGEPGAEESNYQAKALQQVAATVLRTLAIALDQAPEADPSPRMQIERGVLARVIPLALLMALKNPDAGAAKFLAMASADQDGPTGIWNAAVRKELRAKVAARLREVNVAQAGQGGGGAGGSSDDEIHWLESFRYEALKDEMVIAGVFVKGYATGDWQHFDLPDGRAFLVALQDYLESNRHILIGGVVDRTQAPATEDDFLIAIGALGESLRYAVEDAKKGMLQQVRYGLLAEILARGEHLPAAQLEVAAIARVLAGHPLSRSLLLSSGLLTAMGAQLWRRLASAQEQAQDTAAALLDALLALAEEMPATLEATNHFSSTGVLPLLLALFCGVRLPPLPAIAQTDAADAAAPGDGDAGPADGAAAASDASAEESELSEVPESSRQVAAQVLGQLLLAAVGVGQRAALLRKLAVARDAGVTPVSRSSEAADAHATDMYELVHLLEQHEIEVTPVTIRNMYLLLPVHMLSCLARDPLEACQLYDRESRSPELVWDEGTRGRVRALLGRELATLRLLAAAAPPVDGERELRQLPPWALECEHDQPVFLRWVLATVLDNDDIPLFLDDEDEGYAREIYLGGFFLDQFLRQPAYAFGGAGAGEDRLMLEVRKAVVLAAPSTGVKAERYSFDDRRRLLLALLLLFRNRPHLLAASNLDIFLPLEDFLSGGSSQERRGLTQIGLSVFHCTVSTADVADFVVSEELLTLLLNLLSLKVPPAQEGTAGTDPRLCALMLLLRLVRLSSKAVALSLKLDICGKLASLALLLPLLLITIPSEEALLAESKSSSKAAAAAGEPGAEESNYQAKALQQVAATVLRTLAIALDQAPEADPSPRMQIERGVLARVIPLALLMALKNPDAGAAKFLAMASADQDGPTGIWNAAVRKELRAKVAARLREVNVAQAGQGGGGAGGSSDDEIHWLESFRYEALKDEMVIAGVFVKGYATGDWQHFDLPDGRAFLVALQDYLESNRHILIGGVVDRTQAPATEDDFLIAIGALGESLRYAVEDAKKGMLQQVRYGLLAEILARGEHLPAAQLEVAAIARVLAGHPLSRSLLLSSGLLTAMGAQLWRRLASAQEQAQDTAAALLDALLALAEEMPATLEATNHFSSTGVLPLLLALFCGVRLPPLPAIAQTDAADAAAPGDGDAGPADGAAAASDASAEESELSEVPESSRQVAAQVLGQLLLAAVGVGQRAALLRKLAVARDAGVTPVSRSSEAADAHATDMYELVHLLEQHEIEVTPVTIRNMYLLLPVHMLSCLARDPLEACQLYDRESRSPELVWDEGTRGRVRALLGRELATLRLLAAAAPPVDGERELRQLPPWALECEHDQPVFLRWVLATVLDNDDIPLFLDDEDEGYAREIYLGGFFLDQFLRQPAYAFGGAGAGEDRLMLEVRKAVVLAAPSTGVKAERYSFDDRRRLLLALLLLFRNRPHLLAASNLDIFLPLEDFLSGGSSQERRGLTQIGLSVFHCTVSTADVADFVVSEELLTLLLNLLSLKVPPAQEGTAGTDPRLCALMLLLRLVRLSSKAVALSLKLDICGKLASLVLITDGSPVIRTRAAEILAVMKGDKRQGADVQRALDRCIPESAKSYTAWDAAPPGGSGVRDEAVDDASVDHFLRHKLPAEWWLLDTLEGVRASAGDAVGPTSVVEATVKFPDGSLEGFTEEAEGLFRHSVAATARVQTKNVRILRKLAGSLIVEMLLREPEHEARAFKQALETGVNRIFTAPVFGPMGLPSVSSVAVRSWGKMTSESQASPGLSRSASETSSTSNTIASASASNPAANPTVQIVYQIGGHQHSGGLSRQPSVPSNLSRQSSMAPAGSLVRHASMGGSMDSFQFAAARATSMSDDGTSEPAQQQVIYMHGGDHTPESILRASGMDFGGMPPNFVIQQPPPQFYQAPPQYYHAPPPGYAPPPPPEGGQLPPMYHPPPTYAPPPPDYAHTLVERFPKLVQKYPLQPQLCYDLVCTWEEHCLDLLNDEEMKKHFRSLAAFDMCRFDDVEAASEEAKKKFAAILKIRKEKEWKEKSKQIKGDMSAELAKAVGGRKEKMNTENAKDEIKAMTKGKIQKKKKPAE